jgi:tRNA threonylcarbamoyl adenosine modification protein YeaZ
VLLLALDTATPATTVALHDGERVLAARSIVDARRHGEVLAPLVATVLAEVGARAADLTDCAVGVGPGPYTGLRVGLATALALGAGTGAALHGVCSLDVVAAGARAAGAGAVAVATDARRREVYWATYDADGARTDGPGVGRPDVVVALLADLPVAGAGVVAYPQLGRAVAPQLPDAADLADLAVAALAAGRGFLDITPLYLRHPDAVPPGPPRPVGGTR